MEIQTTKFNSIFCPKTSPFKHKPANQKPQFVKPFKTLKFSISSFSHPNKPSSQLLLNPNFHPNSSLKSIRKTTQNSENYSISQKLKRGKLTPLELLQKDGDWSKTQFWDVIEFLHESSRFHEILEVFNAWTKLQESRINEMNYNKIIRLLSEAGMTDEAALQLQNMKNSDLQLCTEVYNSIIHGYAQEGKFDDALRYLNEMEETNVKSDTETYDGLIKAYGKFQMYDEMVKCLKRMENCGCSPDHVTYNVLIQELAKGRLLNRMERMYHTLVSKRMNRQSSTLVAILEAYVDFGELDKMERFYVKIRKSKTVLKERMIRKIARVYVENHIFSRLDDLANDLGVKRGRTNLFWCLRLLSHACQLSKKGMNDVIQEMEEENVPWNASIVNIMSFAYLKMRDFKQLDMIFSVLPYRHVKPDLVTFGVLFDGHNVGFEWSRTLNIWRKYGYFGNDVEVNTDPLVFAAFGKGLFLTTVEESSSLLEPKMREEKLWTYEALIDFVLRHHGSSP
ncbi:hypothetical protein RND81_05G172700 [Saponaria officinalis]|uniref:Pentatricopeptide repeat-containing protein n=1 Tax=Saponaria officinalis TaxID=3572 RepID=A0AAW1KZK0_SAPOF